MPLPVIEDKPVEHKPKSPIDEETTRVKAALRNIKHKIGVHAGKGGVGKTFVACNLALTLAAEGYAVGLLDADIDCPNVPSFLNTKAELSMDERDHIVPLVYKGMKVVSTGYVQDESDALIIRGPIKHRVLLDFLERTNWGPLDYLVMDFPPGTSDVPLSAMQYADLSGILLVTTPHKEAIADCIRAAAMAKQLHIPIIGLIENMSGDIFGSKGEETARRINAPFLGSIPLSKETRELSEQGEAAFLESSLETFTSNLLKRLPQ